MAGAVAVGHDDRPACGVLLDALRGDRPRRQRPIAQRRNNAHHTDDRGTTLQPLVALIPLEFGLDSCILELSALALGLLAGPRLPDGRRARARRRRVLEPHAAAGRGLAGLMAGLLGRPRRRRHLWMVFSPLLGWRRAPPRFVTGRAGVFLRRTAFLRWIFLRPHFSLLVVAAARSVSNRPCRSNLAGSLPQHMAIHP